MTDHRALRESLGAYALDALEPDATAAVGAHLDGCADCRAELTEVRSVLGPLSRVDPEALASEPVPPPDLGDRVLARVRAEPRGRERRPRGVWLAAAAVTVVALAGAAGGYAVGAGGEDPAAPREALAVQALAPGVGATADAIPHTWGVEIILAADGFRPGATYRVMVADDAGRRIGAGEFLGTGDAAMTCHLNSSVRRADATGFDVVDDAGAVVVHGDL